MKGIQVCTNKGPGTIQRGDNQKNVVGSLKILFLRTMKPENTEFYMKAL
jgi:hypothetical protein